MNNFNWAADLVNHKQPPSTSGHTSINKNNDEGLTAIVNGLLIMKKIRLAHTRFQLKFLGRTSISLLNNICKVKGIIVFRMEKMKRGLQFRVQKKMTRIMSRQAQLVKLTNQNLEKG